MRIENLNKKVINTVKRAFEARKESAYDIFLNPEPIENPAEYYLRNAREER